MIETISNYHINKQKIEPTKAKIKDLLNRAVYLLTVQVVSELESTGMSAFVESNVRIEIERNKQCNLKC